jgi:DNA-binding GntR family transcriptional regulator
MQESAPRAVTAICLALQEQIEHGLLSAGCQLPAERKLSEVFATTRITLREALLQLEAKGLIYREERRGWFISPPRLLYDLVQRSHFHAMVHAQCNCAERGASTDDWCCTSSITSIRGTFPAFCNTISIGH